MPEIATTVTKQHRATSGPDVRQEGGIRISMTTAGDEKLPDFVILEWNGEEGEVARVHIQPEVLERAAALMKTIRHDACDFRQVCADHGYFGGSLFAECPKCKPGPAAAVPEPTEAPAVPAPASTPVLGF